MPAIFQPRFAKKNQLSTLSQVNSDHRLLCRDSYKGVDRALTSDESRLHKIIIIIRENIILPTVVLTTVISPTLFCLLRRRNDNDDAGLGSPAGLG